MEQKYALDLEIFRRAEPRDEREAALETARAELKTLREANKDLDKGLNEREKSSQSSGMRVEWLEAQLADKEELMKSPKPRGGGGVVQAVAGGALRTRARRLCARRTASARARARSARATRSSSACRRSCGAPRRRRSQSRRHRAAGDAAVRAPERRSRDANAPRRRARRTCRSEIRAHRARRGPAAEAGGVAGAAGVQPADDHVAQRAGERGAARAARDVVTVSFRPRRICPSPPSSRREAEPPARTPRCPSELRAEFQGTACGRKSRRKEERVCVSA